MATIYVSYRSTEEPFVRAVVSHLAASHRIHIDYEIPAGADFRSQQLEELRTSDVFLVFVSGDTRQSDFQNAEMGGARFCQAFVDGKMIIPALIDGQEPPRPLAHLDYLDLRHRDAQRAATEIDMEINGQPPRIRLFVSHAHRDADIAARLVDVIASNLEVPTGELRCTSVPGYQLDLGAMAPDRLRRELGSAACVVALLTPNSLGNDWVLFELGAAWANARVTIPVLAGGLEDKDIPGPLRGAAGGQLSAPTTIDRLVDQLARVLGWRPQNSLNARSRAHDFVDYVKSKTFSESEVDDALKASFAAKRARIGTTQGRLLDEVTRLARRPYVVLGDLEQAIAASGSELYYRLEQLRLLGFLARTELGESGGVPTFGWALSSKYRRELGL